jgi:hypothetical protein
MHRHTAVVKAAVQWSVGIEGRQLRRDLARSLEEAG